MALLWMDGFDHYGTGATGNGNMLRGAWAEAGAGQPIASGRTGPYNYRIDGASGVPAGILRRIFGAPKQTVGCGYAVYMAALPGANGAHALFEYRNNANKTQVNINLLTTGAVRAMRANYTDPASESGGASSGYTTLAQSADGVIVAEAWQHIESRVYIHNTAGSVEVRVDGATVLSITGVDTCGITYAEEVSQVATYTSYDGGSFPHRYVDDIFAWDTVGGGITDFVGDCRVRTMYPTANEATQEWTPNTGAAWDAINDAVQDGDTTYLLADPTGMSPPYTTSEFTLEDLPATVSSIAALQTYTLVKKTDAGVATLQSSLVSGSYSSNGVDRPVTTAYTYWPDVHEVDPATGAAWTRAGANAAKLRIRRTAE